MLSKFVIRNVGVLRAFDTPNAPKLEKLTLFYGRNGRGKPKVVLVSAAGTITFDNGGWNAKAAPVEVFDTAFITDNVYAGELIELAHDRGLFSVIIGADGVRLAKHLERFNVIAKTCATALKDAEAALADDVPSDMSKEEFFALGPNPDYAKRLDATERALKAVQQADKIASLKPLEALTMPELPAGLPAVLIGTVADIEASARGRLLNHFKRFGFDKKGEAWISYGVEHIHDDACPLCGRDDVDAEGMVTLYGQIFGETYKAHLGTITTASTELEDSLG